VSYESGLDYRPAIKKARREREKVGTGPSTQARMPMKFSTIYSERNSINDSYLGFIPLCG
jgi:hypothetical protein